MNKQVTTTGRSATRQVAVALAMCVSISACADTAKIADTGKNKSENLANPALVQSTSTESGPRHRAASEGKNYKWGKDHIFVKLSSTETGGVVTVIQDNLKPGFDLGLHLHRAHTEIFYILAGEIEFNAADKTHAVTAGATIYSPAGIPPMVTSTTGARLLVFRTPGGTDATPGRK